MTTRRTTRAKQEPEEQVWEQPQQEEHPPHGDKGNPEKEGQGSTLAAGSGQFTAPATIRKPTLYMWPAPGHLVVKELDAETSGMRGDNAIGEVAIAPPDLAPFYPAGLPVVYPTRLSPQFTVNGVQYAFVKHEHVLGTASHDEHLMTRYQQGQQAQFGGREAFEGGYDQVADYRASSSQTSSPPSQTSVSPDSGPFGAWTGNS